MSEDWAVKIEHLSKVYKIFDKPTDRVKEAFHPFHKRYSKDFYALNDISLTIKKGETIGIIGKNGAGKSTLLKIITGVLTPSSGTIQVNGRIASLLELGAGFNPEMTGIENIYMNGVIMGYDKEEMDERLQDIIDFADIGDFIHQPVKMYSSGMFARLAFAVNAFVEPDILIVDEALSVGDVFFQNKCFRKFEDLRKQDVTILFVSHDMGAIRRFCDHVVWLEQGNIKALGACDEVCASYLEVQLQVMNAENETSEAGESIEALQPTPSDEKVVFPPLDRHTAIQNHPEEGKIISFFFSDKDGKTVTTLYTGNAYRIHVVAEFYQDIRDAIFGVTLDTPNGISVLGINSYMTGHQGISVKAKTVVDCAIEFELPLLREGDYIFSPAIARGTQFQHVNIEYLPFCGEIHIVNDGHNITLLEIKTKHIVKTYSQNVYNTVTNMVCSICGKSARFIIRNSAVLLREARCEFCGCSLRTADVATHILQEFNSYRNKEILNGCVISNIKILNLASSGKIHECLNENKDYYCGEFFDGIKSGEYHNNVQCIDLMSIPYNDGFFDLIITEDVLEHVEDYRKAFKEISRVLSEGGCHIFTVPVHEGYSTEERIDMQEIYHSDPLRETGTLVKTDFGDDLIELLSAYGMDTVMYRDHIFYAPKDITNMHKEEDYERYMIHRDDLMQAFKYNSIVMVSKKKRR